MAVNDPSEIDEVRRLLYMAKAASRTERHSLVGTLTNALAHHGFGVDAEEAMDQLVAAIDGSSDGVEWVRDTIRQITDQVDALPEPERE